MSSVLLTFLGRAHKKGYSRTSYDFGDGTASAETGFFGWALNKRLTTQRMVILGTAGSMWDYLFEGDFTFGVETEDMRIRLLGAVERQQVTLDMLQPLAAALSEHLGCEVQFEIIPYCREEREQIELLEIMARHVGKNDPVHLDITHGLRHLPMIALLSALHLKVVRNARIEGIWYGAYEPETKKAPVHNLVGLLKIASWLQAMHTYDKDGDYAVFAQLLGAAGEHLATAAYYERTTNPVKAREALNTWSQSEDRYPTGDPAADLFRDELDKRVNWYRKPRRAEWERALATEYVERGDYVRAIIYGLESVITSEVQSLGKNENSYGDREDARIKRGDKKDGYRTLTRLRNTMAHGTLDSDKKIKKIISSEPTLKNTIKSLFKQLFT